MTGAVVRDGSSSSRPEGRTTPSKGKVVVMIPALNEELAIGRVIDSVPVEAIRVMGFDTDIVVVDGRSVDQTLEIARQKGAKIYTQDGKGKGLAVRQAFLLRNPQEVVFKVLSLTTGIDSGINALSAFLDSQYIIMLDGDGTYPADIIPEFISALEVGSDVVMGSRLKGSIENGAMTELNKAGNRILSRIASMLYAQPVTDLCTGMWGFRTNMLRAMSLDSNYFELEAEMFAESAKRRLRIKEIPIAYAKRAGQSKLVPMKAGFLIAAKLFERRFLEARFTGYEESTEADIRKPLAIEITR
jgi:glycosyltransferase involved in cell wall biosynthesis